MRRRLFAAAVAATVLSGSVALASSNLAGMLVKTVAAGAIVNAVAKPADKGINALLLNHHVPCGTATKVVPILSVGEKGYVGMAQVAGAQDLVNRTKSVVQFETSFSNKQYRIKLLMPMNSVNPIGVSRVKGLGVSALLDLGLNNNAYELPESAGWNAGDVLKAAAIGYAAAQYGEQIDNFINKAYQAQGGTPAGETKVVPYLSFGSKAYIGMMQIAGPAKQVRQVKAVWQLEQLFDSGRIRLRALVPSNSLNPLQLKRISGVGCTAVIDATVLRAQEEKRHPEHYRYFRRAPVFCGAYEDPLYRRPRGWDRGEKIGWERHSNSWMPPGQAKKQPPVVIFRGERPRHGDGGIRINEGRPGDLFKIKAKDKDKDKDEDQDRGRGRGRGHGRGRR